MNNPIETSSPSSLSINCSTPPSNNENRSDIPPFLANLEKSPSRGPVSLLIEDNHHLLPVFKQTYSFCKRYPYIKEKILGYFMNHIAIDKRKWDEIYPMLCDRHEMHMIVRLARSRARSLRQQAKESIGHLETNKEKIIQFLIEKSQLNISSSSSTSSSLIQLQQQINGFYEMFKSQLIVIYALLHCYIVYQKP